MTAKAARRSCAKARRARRPAAPGDRSRRRTEAIVEASRALPAHRQCKTPILLAMPAGGARPHPDDSAMTWPS
jgi:hypothetical protein